MPCSAGCARRRGLQDREQNRQNHGDLLGEHGQAAQYAVQPQWSNASIASGAHDAYIKMFANSVKKSGIKAQASIQADQLRVSSKVKDNLQAVMAFLRGKDFGLDLQFTNYR